MKKLLITAALTVVTVASALAQGRVSFNNTAFGTNIITVGTQNMGAAGGTAGSGIAVGTYSVQLVWAPDAVYGSQAAFDAAVIGSSNPLAINAAPGIFAAGAVPNPTGTSMPGGTYQMQVRAWYNNATYATYAAAYAAGVNTGLSPLFTQVATVSPTTAPTTFFAAFTVGVVPEPSSLALAGLGAAALLVFRRRK